MDATAARTGGPCEAAASPQGPLASRAVFRPPATPRRHRWARSLAVGCDSHRLEGSLPTDQVNLTDEESRIMPMAGGGFEQCYNAQAAVADSLLVVATDVMHAPNDKQQLEPMLGRLAELPDKLGKVGDLLADNGYSAAAGIEPVISMEREAHHPSQAKRFVEDPMRQKNRTPIAAMLPSAPEKGAQGMRRPAQADPRASVRHHQVGARIPPVPAARPRQGGRRTEPRDHGVTPTEPMAFERIAEFRIDVEHGFCGGRAV
jgi:hypothetical protein